MMLVGSVLFCCCRALRRREQQRQQASLARAGCSGAGEDEDGFSNIELTDAAPGSRSVLGTSAGALINGVVATLSPQKSRAYSRDDGR